MDKKPGKEFSEEAKPFLEEIREQATNAYRHMVRISQELGLKVQKTLNHAPKFGINGMSRPTSKRPTEEDEEK